MKTVRTAALALAAACLAGCGDPLVTDLDFGLLEAPFSSDQATLLDFEFQGELYTTGTWSLDRVVEDQMLYTIGHLNGNRAVGRLDRLELSDLERVAVGDGLYRVTYRAKLPVGWGSKTNLPTSYDFVLPRRVDYQGLTAFSSKYKDTCVDWGAHDVDSGSMWYYYRPARSGCSLDEADVVRFSATVTVSDENTTGKYPEYHQVWNDDALDVVAIFGKYEDGATSGSDAGIAAYNRFLASARSTLGSGVTTVPASVPSNPGVNVPDVTFEAVREGKRITITALLVDNVRTAGPAFDARYNALSETADMIFYNGHAGLGANVAALASKGRFLPGKYQIFFMNGCDTYAYVDGALAQKKAAINEDDPNGTKYLDMVTNVMPSYFHSMASASMALIKGLLAQDAPRTYEEMFREIDRSEVVVVTGEQDNVYFPGYEEGSERWEGMTVEGAVDRGAMDLHETGTLPAGAYLFTLAPKASSANTEDADLYVRVGAAPTATSYDCRPYKSGSNEQCQVSLSEPAVVFVGVEGYAMGASSYVLTGVQLGGETGDGWEGLTAPGAVAQGEEARWETPELAAGTYRVAIAHDAANAGGDADLYVKTGAAPTATDWDCRPYENGSEESCTVTLAAPAVVHVMVRGYAASTSHFVLTAVPQ